MTKALYLENTYLFEHDAVITGYGEDERGEYLVLNQTIFYPQGGGQPSDQGIMYVDQESIQIHCVRTMEQEIRHYSVNAHERLVDKKALLCIDEHKRLLHSRYHTAGQLIGNFIESIFSDVKVLKSHQWPKEACMEFSPLDTKALAQLENELNNLIAKNRKIKIFSVPHNEFSKVFTRLVCKDKYGFKDILRAVQIEGFAPVPCGGTHLSALGEIGTIKIKKISVKADRTKVGYDVE